MKIGFVPDEEPAEVIDMNTRMRLALDTADGKDNNWLATLPVYCTFLCQPRITGQDKTLKEYHVVWQTGLSTKLLNNRLKDEFTFWVVSEAFSKSHRLHEVLNYGDESAI